MKRVIGVGGIFFKAKDPQTLVAWYKKHLGMDVQDWGGVAFQDPPGTAPSPTIWSVFKSDSTMFNPSTAPFMINYRVDDLDALLTVLREEGCAVEDKTDDSSYGKFGWVMDPEGNRIELWQPPTQG